jgi:hypothetical protein
MNVAQQRLFNAYPNAVQLDQKQGSTKDNETVLADNVGAGFVRPMVGTLVMSY